MSNKVEPEEGSDPRPVDAFCLARAFQPLTEYYRTTTAEMLRPLAETVISTSHLGEMIGKQLAAVWYAHAEYWPKNGDPIPRVFGRHPSAHGVSRTQYSRINAVYGLMLVTSVLKFFDVELKW